MKISYPSKNFLADVRKSLDTGEILEISINSGWRRTILAKEVSEWLPLDDVELIRRGPWRAPSLRCSLLMAALHGVHYTMLSANYEMRNTVSANTVVLTYLPLSAQGQSRQTDTG